MTHAFNKVRKNGDRNYPESLRLLLIQCSFWFWKFDSELRIVTPAILTPNKHSWCFSILQGRWFHLQGQGSRWPLTNPPTRQSWWGQCWSWAEERVTSTSGWVSQTPPGAAVPFETPDDSHTPLFLSQEMKEETQRTSTNPLWTCSPSWPMPSAVTSSCGRSWPARSDVAPDALWTSFSLPSALFKTFPGLAYRISIMQITIIEEEWIIHTVCAFAKFSEDLRTSSLAIQRFLHADRMANNGRFSPCFFWARAQRADAQCTTSCLEELLCLFSLKCFLNP